MSGAPPRKYFQRIRGKTLGLVLVIASIAAAGTLAEGVLWMKGWHGPPPNPPRCIYWDSKICSMYQAYEPYGYRLWPSRVMEYQYPKSNPRLLTVQSNRHGFRGRRELNEADDRLRIAVFGDSFVFGEGVQEQERFTNMLEELHPAWRLDNLGMTGWGPDLMLRALETVGVGLKPDVVVFCLYTDDFRRVHPSYIGVGFSTPRVALMGKKLVNTDYPEPRPWNRSRVVHLISRVYWNWTGTERKINEAVLDRVEDLSRKADFVPVLLFLPGTGDVPIDKQRRFWLQRYAKGKGIHFLDLSDPIHEYPLEQVFIKGNPHYNPFGHQVVAQHLKEFLDREVMPGFEGEKIL